jgi:DNA polymerase elongation subunit (family B)
MINSKLTNLHERCAPNAISSLSDAELLELFDEANVAAKQESYNNLTRYNILDVDLIVKMNNKKRFLELTYTLAYICKCNYEDTLGTVKPWSALTYSMLYDKGQQPKIKSLYEGDTQFGGGFVRDVKPGRYKWVVSCDLNSLDV